MFCFSHLYELVRCINPSRGVLFLQSMCFGPMYYPQQKCDPCVYMCSVSMICVFVSHVLFQWCVYVDDMRSVSAIYGCNLCTGGMRAVKTILNNILRVGTINSLGTFTLFVGKVLVVASTVIIGLQLLKVSSGPFEIINAHLK